MHYRLTFDEPILYLPNGEEAETAEEQQVATDHLASQIVATRGTPTEVSWRRLIAEFPTLDDVRLFLNSFLWSDGGASEWIGSTDDIDLKSGEATVTGPERKITVGTGLIELVE
jgi:hypothetical protein